MVRVGRPPTLRTLTASLTLTALLAGCASSRGIDPVAWWHGLEGGPIAAQRPPPPDADAPYPKLGTVPARPPPIDPAQRAKVYAALAADRADATYEAQQAPLVAPPEKTKAGLFAGPRPLPAPGADIAGAALDAAEAPPARPVPAQAPQAPALDDAPIPDAAAPAGPPPPIPDAPPPQPQLAGVVLPVTIPHLPPSAPPAPAVIAPALTLDQKAAVPLAFPSGSAVLPLSDQAALLALAVRRGNHAIEIIGFGESEATDAASGIAGVRLGVARARAVGLALAGYGVPPGSLTLRADAPGRGAAARLID